MTLEAQIAAMGQAMNAAWARETALIDKLATAIGRHNGTVTAKLRTILADDEAARCETVALLEQIASRVGLLPERVPTPLWGAGREAHLPPPNHRSLAPASATH